MSERKPKTPKPNGSRQHPWEADVTRRLTALEAEQQTRVRHENATVPDADPHGISQALGRLQGQINSLGTGKVGHVDHQKHIDTVLDQALKGAETVAKDVIDRTALLRLDRLEQRAKIVHWLLGLTLTIVGAWAGKFILAALGH